MTFFLFVFVFCIFSGLPLHRPAQSDPRIAAYMPLVRSRARSYFRGRLAANRTIEDLVAIGMEALWEATQRWREDGGMKFGPYARRLIDRALLNERISLYTASRNGFTFSLTSSDDDEQMDVESPGPTPETEVAATEIRGMVRSLPPLMRRIVEGRYFQGESFDDVGAVLGFSRQYAHQLESDALHTLKQMLLQKAGT